MKNLYLFVAVIAMLLSLHVKAQISCGINLPQHTGCAPFAILATANDNSPYPILERKWRLNNQSGQLIYSTPIAPGSNQNFAYIIASDTCATFYLSLWSKNTNGDTCMAYDTVFVAGKPMLQPVLAASCNSTPKTVTLYPNATTCAGVLDTFAVDWGCGPPTILNYVPSSISHTYTCLDTCYDIVIVVSNSFGCLVNTTLYDVCFNTPVTPAGYISADTFNCPNPPNLIQYYDTSSAHTSGTWDFGDGTSSSSDTTIHIYSLPGNYVVKRIVCNGVCCDTAIIDTVVIKGPYIKSYSYFSNRLCACKDTLHLRLEVVGASMVSLVAGCNTGFLSYQNIQPIGTEQNPTIIEQDLQYCFTDSCQPQVILSSPSGCQTYFDLPFFYVDTPAVDFAFSGLGVCSSGAVCFTDLTTYAAQHDSTAVRIWNFGDGSQPDSSVSPCHMYAQPGIYNVTLSAFSDNGCNSSVTKQVPVNMPPVVGFTAQRIDTVCNQATWMFIDTSVINVVSPVAVHTWNFGDGQGITVYGDTVYHTYTSQAVFSVKLKVSDVTGCTDSVTKSVAVSFSELEVQANSIGTFDSCLSYTECFSFAATTGTAINWQWVIDGLPFTGIAPCKTYHTDGQYSATVYVNDGQVCADTQAVNYNIQFPALPSALFNITRQNACIDGNFCFEDLSTYANQADSIVSWLWNFGDGTTDTTHAPCHYFATEGKHVITLSVSTATGCKSSYTDTLRHYFSYYPVASFTATPMGNHAFEFTNTSTGFFTYALWKFGDGVTSSPTNPNQIVTHVYGPLQWYTATLVIRDSTGCADSTSVVVEIWNGLIEADAGIMNIHVTPNPFHTYTSVMVEGVTESFDLTLMSLLGEKLLIKQGKPNEPLRIDRENLPAGVYVYEVKTRSGLKATGKLVVE